MRFFSSRVNSLPITPAPTNVILGLVRLAPKTQGCCRVWWYLNRRFQPRTKPDRHTLYRKCRQAQLNYWAAV
jgi:hypothetical protein